jgi:UrcA family protein
MNMNKNRDANLFAALSALILIAAIGVTGHALAADRSTGPQIHIRYADLNVQDSAGAAALLHRIRVAADEVCGVGMDRDLARIVQSQVCAKKAVSDAVAAANLPTLTSLYQVKTANHVTLASIR